MRNCELKMPNQQPQYTGEIDTLLRGSYGDCLMERGRIGLLHSGNHNEMTVLNVCV